LVSLPFSDHCDILAGRDEHVLLSALESELQSTGIRYVELRSSREICPEGWRPADSYCLHELDLEPDVHTLFRNCHKDSIQRKVRRAERERLTYREDSSTEGIDQFYGLFLQTRRRHGVPPASRQWFRNLADCCHGQIKIRFALSEQRPIAAMITLQYGQTLMYKYGCSDARLHNQGGMHLLFWRCIQEAKQNGLKKFDLGRSDWDQPGLLQFKDRWGAARSTLTYVRYGGVQKTGHKSKMHSLGFIKKLVSFLPDGVLEAAGAHIYPHLG
jgi:lipid II:glycine glycyltransferase (peptidoglycan interpeptide bridge formation enzyme)